MFSVFHIKKAGFPTKEERIKKIEKLVKTYGGKVVEIWSTKHIVSVIVK
ncbi:hypothetical protein HY085_03540 [Candidatus Gottesmanbacteria bacterium]|nr:hypothetical protein [Candidatus Gottesmanbacteria bacterium]